MIQIKCGLEVHCYLNMEHSRQKLFCGCAIQQDAKPNSNTCPVCTAMPGSKPMAPNKEAMDKILAIALMLDCKPNHNLIFQRKHYSWPDLPSGYQRTMSGSYAVPVGEHGTFLGIGITEVHLEEDPARWDPDTGTVDYNRSGLPLAEIVTEPEFTSPEQVKTWLKHLMTTLSYIKAVDKDAGIKADVNVSIPPAYGRVEIKNVNSFTAVVKALEYEAERQQQEIKQGKVIEQQTRAWNDTLGKTVFMRSKEQAMDYMFIPDPDLAIVKVDSAWLKKIEAALPEKPQQKVQKYQKHYKLDKEHAEIIASDINLAVLYEKVAMKVDPILAAQWLRRELLRVMHYNDVDYDQLKIDETHLIELLTMVQKKEITETVAKKILEQLMEKPFSPQQHVEKEGLKMVADTGQLEQFCKQAMKDNPKAVEDYKRGEENALNFVVGSVMKMSRGKASAAEVKEILKKLLR